MAYPFMAVAASPYDHSSDESKLNYALDCRSASGYFEIHLVIINLAGFGNRSHCMKSERHLPRSAQTPNAYGTQAVRLSYPVEHASAKLAKERSSKALSDLETLLCFSQQLYAHALTLQEVIRSEGAATYEALRPKYDHLAAQQFEVLHHTFKPPSRSRK